MVLRNTNLKLHLQNEVQVRHLIVSFWGYQKLKTRGERERQSQRDTQRERERLSGFGS